MLCRSYDDYDRHCGLANIDYFYIGTFPFKAFHHETLTRLSIAPEKLIQTGCTSDCLLDVITNRSTACGEVISKCAYEYVRKLLKPKAVSQETKRRIYIQRGEVVRRRVINEADVVSLLERYNFEATMMDGKSVAEQAELFAQAEVIVAPHGAALTNLLFIQPGTQVIELMPYGYVQNCFQLMASYGQAEYYCLQSKKHPGASDPRFIDLDVDIEKLAYLCQHLDLGFHT